MEVRRCESDARQFVGSAVDNRMHVLPHGTVYAVDMAWCGAGGGTTAGVMLQVTERGGITVFAWTQTNRYAVLMCGVVRISGDRFMHLEMGDQWCRDGSRVPDTLTMSSLACGMPVNVMVPQSTEISGECHV